MLLGWDGVRCDVWCYVVGNRMVWYSFLLCLWVSGVHWCNVGVRVRVLVVAQKCGVVLLLRCGVCRCGGGVVVCWCGMVIWWCIVMWCIVCSTSVWCDMMRCASACCESQLNWLSRVGCCCLLCYVVVVVCFPTSWSFTFCTNRMFCTFHRFNHIIIYNFSFIRHDHFWRPMTTCSMTITRTITNTDRTYIWIQHTTHNNTNQQNHTPQHSTQKRVTAEAPERANTAPETITKQAQTHETTHIETWHHFGEFEGMKAGEVLHNRHNGTFQSHNVTDDEGVMVFTSSPLEWNACGCWVDEMWRSLV